ncbi:16095_t:CDS:1, partial [Gigaspora margarita]
ARGIEKPPEGPTGSLIPKSTDLEIEAFRVIWKGFLPEDPNKKMLEKTTRQTNYGG